MFAFSGARLGEKDLIRLKASGAYLGPSPFSREPVVVADLEIDAEACARAPQIIDAVCQQNGNWLVDRPAAAGSDEGERLARFILDFALAMLTYGQGYLEERGLRRTGPSSFRVWLAFHQPQLSFSGLALSAKQVEAAARGHADPKAMGDELTALWNACGARHPRTQDRIIMEAARARNVPCMPGWGVSRHWQFGWGANSVMTFMGASNADGYVSSQIVDNKFNSKALLRSLGMPTPGDVLVNTEEELASAVEKIGFPCVVKPVDQGRGDGVSVGIGTIDQARIAFRYARRFSQSPIMVEQFAPGRDHRLLIVGGRFVGAFRRDPAAVSGDGRRSIRELVEELNRGRVPAGVESISQLSSVSIDDPVIQHLARQGMSAETILAPGHEVTLRSNANAATGGACTDVTAEVHVDVKAAAEAIAQTLGVHLTGFDYVTTDISRSWREVSGAFIELNLTPSLDVPTLAGWPAVKVGKLALGQRAGRIPLECIVMPEQELVEAENHFRAAGIGDRVGWASHDKAQVGALALQVRALQPWSGVTTLLAHRMVDKAHLLVSSQHMQRFGFPVDQADRVWNCDETLPAEWRAVLDGVSQTPVAGDSLSGIAASILPG